MKRGRWLHTIRWKFLGAMLGSMILTLSVLFFGNMLVTYLIDLKTPLSTPIKWVINNWGSDTVTIVCGIIVLIAVYYVLTIPLIRNLGKIEHSIQEIAAGRFTPVLEIGAKDELGAIAQQVHKAADELNSYLKEIKYGLEQIAAGQVDYVIPVKPAHELGDVADSINRMSMQLMQSLQEERMAEKTKNDLITGVSHDLRTPLTSILGFLELIERDRYHDEVELRYYVNIAYEKANSLKKLIDDLFEYTRINNGMPVKLMELDMVGFMQQLAEEFVPTMEANQIICRLKAPSSPIAVCVDGEQLVRAYENLLSNAIRYGREGKKVDIELVAEQADAVVRITNYGSPIPECDLPFIFDRFYRVDSSRSANTGGTGLGLAITKSIIERQKGKITVQSTIRQTTFETRFPLLQLES